MKRPGFMEGVVVALCASVAGGVVAGALSVALVPGSVIRAVVAMLALAYVVYLLGRSRVRVGRVTALAAWVTGAALTWWTAPPLAAYLLAHLFMVWLVRALYYHTGVLPALADLAVVCAGLAGAVWAAVATGSVFVSTWCFFLVQAAFVLIPSRKRRGPCPSNAINLDDDAFQRAHRAAERAVARITSIS